MIGYLVGYEGTNIFRIWIPQKRKVIRTRDVTFNEEKLYDPQPFMEELLRESSPRNRVTVEIPSLAGAYAESDTSDSEYESISPQTTVPDIREVEDELGEVDEFFDLPGTEPLLGLPTPEPTPEGCSRRQSNRLSPCRRLRVVPVRYRYPLGWKNSSDPNPISIQITSFGNH